MSPIPVVNTSYIHFLQPIALLNFYKSSDDFREPFGFLRTVDSYAEYYKKYEKKVREQNLRPAFFRIREFPDTTKELSPLRIYHAFDSFWKDFRVKAKEKDAAFFLMPLKIRLNDEANSWTGFEPHQDDFRAYAYLFPFGVVCVNLTIRNANQSTFLDLIKLISPFRHSKHGRGFTNWAKRIACALNESIFTKPQQTYDFLAHTMLFLEETDISPVIADPKHREAIAGLIECMEDFAHLDNNYINDCLKCKLPNLYDKEVLVFHPRTTFIYPSSALDKKKKKCMRTNYSDLLNFVFAVRHFIRAYTAEKIPKSHRRLKDVKDAFGIGFPSSEGYALRYFGKLYTPIAEKIGLDKDLKKFMGAE